jgi:hypothetical protein
MSLIELAAEFFDRMANPVYGAPVNEEYALRFAQLMDAEATHRMAQEVRQVRSVSALSPSAWSWLLSWIRTQPQAELSPSVLRDLCEQWESTTFKAEVIRTALSRSDRSLSQDDHGRDQIGIESLPNPWLRELLLRSVRPETAEETHTEQTGTDPAGPTLHSRHVYSLLMALILVETEESLNAAAALLRHPWPGHDSLVSAFWSRADGLEQETQAAWIDRLRPPERPDQHA